MNCPYCNKKLQQVFDDINVFACLNAKCKKSFGMTGTLEMWEKVASLAKIRKAGEKYRKAHKGKKAEYMRKWWKQKKEKQDARN